MSIFLDIIEIYNFKSFAGKTTIGSLLPFTAIIGKNGRGKSNIIDALRFALGDKPSALRVKCSKKLVFGNITNWEQANDPTYVKLILKIVHKVNDTETVRIFKRQLFKNNFYYYMDNEIVTYATYITELHKLGLNTKKETFLVPQGGIEHFAIKSPKKLTAMFEEISGTNIYKTDYENLKLQLLKAKEETHFQYLIKKQKLNEKKITIVEKIEEEKYLQLKKQYNKDKLKYQLIQLVLIKNEFEFLKTTILKINSELDKYQHAKNVTTSKLQTLTSDFKTLSSNIEKMELEILKIEDVLEQEKRYYVTFKDNKLYWQKKCDYARISLNDVNKARDIKKRVIQELQDELQQINLQLTELRTTSQTSVEFSNSQIDHYTRLTVEVEHQAKDFIKEKNKLLHDHEADQNKFYNENRRKKELEDKIKLTQLTKENHETRLKKLRDLNTKNNQTLMEKTLEIQKLNTKIIETRNKSSSLKNDIVTISKELSQADLENNIVSQRIKNNEIITMLKHLSSDVYGRLSDLCKPIHSRYNVAVTKVFDKNMNAIVVGTMCTVIQCIKFLKQNKLSIEIFLPLDSIKTVHLKTNLRDIKEPQNVQLLYDVIQSTLPMIEKAILFVTENTLVCDTPEDARIIAFEFKGQKANNCVSLDGCFYRKNGIISGGETDLNVKAKYWQEREILSLIEQKEQLMQEFRNLPNISLMESDVTIMNTELNNLSRLNKLIEKDLNNTEENFIKTREELDELDHQIIALNMIISEIQNSIQKSAKKIQKVENHINTIKDRIFVDFCEDINVPDINYYEKNNLRNYQEHERKKRELEQQYDRIENQLEIENQSDIESKVLKWERAVEEATTEFNMQCKLESRATFKVEQVETELLRQKNIYATMKKDLENVEKNLAQNKSDINSFKELHLESSKSYISTCEKIKDVGRKCNTILNECKIEDIVIPMLETSYNGSQDTFFTTSSCSNVEALIDSNVIKTIDFSQFPEDICKSTEDDLENIAAELHEKLTKNQSEIKAIANPNFKANDKKIRSISEEIRQININLRNCRNKCDEIKLQFELLKEKRTKQFLHCLNSVAAHANDIYQKLVNNTLAQAIIITDNPEEPYAGNIIYNCIVPSKGLRSLDCLSGAEKSQASLALLFGIQRYKQAPLFVMDEADAALDNINIKNLIHFIESEKNPMQFLTISLNKTFYSNADKLVGVTTEFYGNNVRSKVFGISLNIYK